MVSAEKYVELNGNKVIYILYFIELTFFMVTEIILITDAGVTPETEDKYWYYKWAILIYFYLVQGYYTVHAVYKQNHYELWSFLMFSTVTTVCGANRYISFVIKDGDEDRGVDNSIIVYTGFSIFIQFMYYWISPVLFKQFEKKLYMKAGINKDKQDSLKWIKYFISVMKLLIFMDIPTFFVYWFFPDLHKEHTSIIATFAVLDVLIILALIVSYYYCYKKGVLQQTKKFIVIYLCVQVAVMIYKIAKNVYYWLNYEALFDKDKKPDNTSIELAMFQEAFCIVITLYSIVIGVKFIRFFEEVSQQIPLLSSTHIDDENEENEKEKLNKEEK